MPRSPDGGRMRPGSPNGNCKWDTDTECAQAQLDWVHFSFEEAAQLLETEHFILTTRRKSFCPLNLFLQIQSKINGDLVGSSWVQRWDNCKIAWQYAMAGSEKWEERSGRKSLIFCPTALLFAIVSIFFVPPCYCSPSKPSISMQSGTLF